MEHVNTIKTRRGCDVGWHSTNIEPINREGCVGVRGIDKSYTIDMVIKLAYKIKNKPNIIVRAGRYAKWYLKKVPPNQIESSIDKFEKKNPKTKLRRENFTMYIIVWND